METQPENQDIDLAEFFSVCVYLAEEAGRIIQDIHSSGDLKTKFKIGTDPVTIADFTVQRTVEYNLKKIYPALRFVGEEDKIKYEHIAPTVEDIDELTKKYVSQQLLKDSYEQRKEMLESSHLKEFLSDDPLKFNTINSEVFLDPLDGTRDFVEGRLQNVTCLIGLAINNTSKAGIIHSPYNDDGSSPGSTYFGSIETGLFESRNGEINYMPPFENDMEGEDDHNLKLSMTCNRFDKFLEGMVDVLQPCEYITEGGSGKKAISVFTEKVEAFVYPKKGMSGWDSCAPEALMKARFGCASDILGEQFHYETNMDAINGIIIARNPKVYDTIMGRLAKYMPKLKAACRI